MEMRGWMVAIAAASLLTLVPAKAEAGFCGAARYNCCAPCCQMKCHTVMKTVRCVEYERQEVTCYKTCWERVCEDRVINCVKYVPETRSKEVCYTVCKPVWETRSHTYTVCKPVWETRSKEVCYTVCKPVWEERTRCYTVCKPVWETRCRTYTVCKPVWETRSKEVCYTVCKPVWEERTRCYTVCKPVWENRSREITYHVQVPVNYTKTIKVASGHWETQVYEVPGPTVRKVVREPGTWVYDPCTCRCSYCPGKCHTVCCQCPPRKCCKKVWVPTCCEKEICCTKYVCEARTKTCCYKVCKMVPEQRTCTYKVCKMVPEQRSKTVCYKVCKMVPEERTCTYKVCKMVPEQRTKTVCYTVCKPVCYQKTIQVSKCVPKCVPYTVTRCVPRTVCKQVPVKVYSCCPVDSCDGGADNGDCGCNN